MSMFLPVYKIEPGSFVTDIVKQDYRTADIFLKYGIDFCYGGLWTVELACKEKGLDTAEVLKELRRVVRQGRSGAVMDFEGWDVDFMIDFILNVHHRYLYKALPEIQAYVNRFLEGCQEKYPELVELKTIFTRFMKEFPPHMKQEEEIIFPYIRQIYDAYIHRESYASLLVRTLRKPVEEVMQKEHETTGTLLRRLRELTNNYLAPVEATLTHRVTFAKLKELDTDLVQHIHLENNILFPRAIAMEKELLNQE